MRRNSKLLILVVLLSGLMIINCMPLFGAIPSGIDSTITDPVKVSPYLTYGVLAPTGGVKLSGGQAYTVKWKFNTDTSLYTYITLSYSSDGGTTWNAVDGADQLANDTTSFSWTVPKINTAKAQIRVTGVTIKLTPVLPFGCDLDITAKDMTSSIFTISTLAQFMPVAPFIPLVMTPAAPSDLAASATTSSQIKLTWKDKSSNEDGFTIERKAEGAGSFAAITDVAANTAVFTDTGLTANTKYYYRIKAVNAFGSSDYSAVAFATTPKSSLIPVKPLLPGLTPPITGTIVMKFYIGSTEYYVNDKIQTMDASPVIMGGRTMLPIRYAATPLGASVGWDPATKQVTINQGSKAIQLWIGNNQAQINGASVPIDPDNSSVKPVIIPPGRTMLPLRFVTESLGCTLDWNPATKEVKVTYNSPA